MGEEVQKRRAHHDLLQRYPWCIYCGAAAETVEHMPPRMMFVRKDRPKGLEFPSCKTCNNGTSQTDLVASLLGRLYPDPVSEVGREEIPKLLTSIRNNVPGLLEELWINPHEQSKTL